ncbi:MAG: hypothetical protein IH608_03745 [Proteobacteria bacterium]|nr:hypothetical protein [Pseudomonadota bacterium]
MYEPRPEAADAVKEFAHKGYKIVYLTTRIPAFQSTLPDWLHRNGFPAGTLHVAQNSEERAHPAEYKARVLGMYVQAGWQLVYAYGDSSTDFVAYAKAGIPQAHVFALMRRNSEQCQEGAYQACLAGWAEHLSYIRTGVPVAR